MRFIHRVGIELEGGWNGMGSSEDPCDSCNTCERCPCHDDCEYDHDRSQCDIDVCVDCNAESERGATAGPPFKGDGSVEGITADFVGEAASPVLCVHEMPAWLAEYWPHKSNETCGMHVHISLTSNLNYSRLTSPRFNEYFLSEMFKWGHEINLGPRHRFWPRLEGRNTYCRKHWEPIGQMLHGDCRYTQLNFCYLQHGTVECRLFPMFKQLKIGTLAVYRLCEIVESYLAANQAREYPVTRTLQAFDTPDEYVQTIPVHILNGDEHVNVDQSSPLPPNILTQPIDIYAALDGPDRWEPSPGYCVEDVNCLAATMSPSSTIRSVSGENPPMPEPSWQIGYTPGPTRFSIGDRVRNIAEQWTYESHRVPVGTHGITMSRDNNRYGVRWDGIPDPNDHMEIHPADSLELVTTERSRY